MDDFALRENTIVVFTSDNGPLWERFGGTDSELFNSHGGLRGRKGGYYEGGFRVPCIVRWTGKIKPGTTSERVTGFEDWLPTILELAGAKERTPSGIDGISFAPTLLGRTQPERPFLYREAPDYGGQQSVRVGNWKAIRTNLHPPPAARNQAPGAIELYDLASGCGRFEIWEVLGDGNPTRALKVASAIERDGLSSDVRCATCPARRAPATHRL